MDLDELDGMSERRKSAYSSRLSRARAFNSERRGLTRGSSSAVVESMANAAFSIPVQAEVDVAALSVSNMVSSGTPSSRPPPKPVKNIEDGKATVFWKPEDEQSIAAHWEWNATQKLMAVVR